MSWKTPLQAGYFKKLLIYIWIRAGQPRYNFWQG